MNKLMKSLWKGIIWEIIGITILYLITKDLRIGILYVTIRVVLFPVFEALWKCGADKNDKQLGKKN